MVDMCEFGCVGVYFVVVDGVCECVVVGFYE